ncbi:lipase family protein [Methylobacterium oryzae]|uniref:lipase family protein n=1 Tax=Methylobacterium oryzae TaxID=334852 RepID=UPI002F35F1C3
MRVAGEDDAAARRSIEDGLDVADLVTSEGAAAKRPHGLGETHTNLEHRPRVPHRRGLSFLKSSLSRPRHRFLTLSVLPGDRGRRAAGMMSGGRRRNRIRRRAVVEPAAIGQCSHPCRRRRPPRSLLVLSPLFNQMVRGYLSFTPFKLRDLHPPPVARRHVFFIHGFDARSGIRFPAFFKRELDRHTTRFGSMPRAVSAIRTDPDGLSRSWTVSAPADGDGAAVRCETLIWSDIVHADLARPMPRKLALLARSVASGLAQGLFFKTARFGWPYTLLSAFPFFVAFVAPALLIVLGTAVFAAVNPSAGTERVWVALLLATAAIAVLYVTRKALGRLFFWHILSIRIFFWQHATGRRPDYEARIAVFRERVLAELSHWRAHPADAPDEVMIVGHSLGAAMAVEVAAQVLAQLGTDDRPHPQLSLVTLGSGLPFVALQNEARRLREDIATLVFSDRIVWCDYQAPQDWLNCYGFNPLFDLGIERPAFLAWNPLIRSAGVKDRIPEDDYKRLRLKPFHMHFQFLKANFRPGEYDFYEMILGRQSLLDRALRPICRRPAPPSPGGGRVTLSQDEGPRPDL